MLLSSTQRVCMRALRGKINKYTFKIETGYAFALDMKDEILEKFDDPTPTQGSAILKVLYHYPPDLLFQHLPIERKLKNQVK